jgi:hypothetical protein
MMRQPLQLQIAEPCHENWQQMPLQQQGRLCANCQKTVVDFTNMTDNAVLEYFKNFKGDTCGRFTDDQLQRPLTPLPPHKQGWLKWAIASVFSCFIFSSIQPSLFKQQSVALVSQAYLPTRQFLSDYIFVGMLINQLG